MLHIKRLVILSSPFNVTLRDPLINPTPYLESNYIFNKPQIIMQIQRRSSTSLCKPHFCFILVGTIEPKINICGLSELIRTTQTRCFLFKSRYSSLSTDRLLNYFIIAWLNAWLLYCLHFWFGWFDFFEPLPCFSKLAGCH